MTKPFLQQRGVSSTKRFLCLSLFVDMLVLLQLQIHLFYLGTWHMQLEWFEVQIATKIIRTTHQGYAYLRISNHAFVDAITTKWSKDAKNMILYSNPRCWDMYNKWHWCTTQWDMYKEMMVTRPLGHVYKEMTLMHTNTSSQPHAI